MKLHAFVMHNVSRDMFFRYEDASSALHHAHTFVVEADDLENAANLIWILTNVDSADHLRLDYPHLAQYADAVTHYRSRKNRSLSVGDVIVFLERERYAGARALAMIGHEVVAFDPSTIRTVTNERPESDAYLAHQRFFAEQRG